MNITTLIEPTVEPVTLAEVWRQLRLNPDVDDSPPSHPDDPMLLRLITEARIDCEKKTRRSFVKQKVRLSIDPRTRWWPWGAFGYPQFAHGPIELKRPPVVEVTAVSYYDSANTLQLVDPARYFVTDEEPAKLHFDSGFAVCDAYPRSDALRIEYWAGYPWNDSPIDLAGNVPETIKGAILLGVQMAYDPMSPAQRLDAERAQKSLLSTYIVQLAI